MFAITLYYIMYLQDGTSRNRTGTLIQETQIILTYLYVYLYGLCVLYYVLLRFIQHIRVVREF